MRWIVMAAVLALPLLGHAQEVATSDPAVICGKVDGMSYSRQHRKLLLDDDRRADFARWGVPWSEHRHYELDHWIPLSLGGADTPANRRPQRCDRWEGYRCVAGPAYEKDWREAEAEHAVCEEAPSALIRGIMLDEWRKIFAGWKEW